MSVRLRCLVLAAAAGAAAGFWGDNQPKCYNHCVDHGMREPECDFLCECIAHCADRRSTTFDACRQEAKQCFIESPKVQYKHLDCWSNACPQFYEVALQEAKNGTRDMGIWELNDLEAASEVWRKALLPDTGRVTATFLLAAAAIVAVLPSLGALAAWARWQYRLQRVPEDEEEVLCRAEFVE